MTTSRRTPAPDPSPAPGSEPLSRRSFCLHLGAASLTLGCDLFAPLEQPLLASGDGRLAVRPSEPTATITPGVHRLGLANSRDGFIVVPEGYVATRSWPLALFFHGAGGTAVANIGDFIPLADEAGLVLLSPDSRGSTWDLARGGFGPDVEFLDRAMAEVFRRVRVDPARISMSGFSDGASYALSLGVTNGDLVSRVAAFSPGFYTPTQEPGKPKVFVTHGTGDRVLQLETTSRRIVDRLRREGYDVTYHEFDGGHVMVEQRVREAFAWMAQTA